MKIASIESFPYRAVLTRPMITSRGAVDTRRGFVVHLTDEEGCEGWGEAGPIHWLEGELGPNERALVRMSGLAGRTDEELRSRLDSMRRAYPAAACALDTALLDLGARSAGTCLAKHLDATAKTLPHVSALLSQVTPARLAAEAVHRRDGGYRCMKIKVGAGTPMEDVDRVAAVREVFDGEIRLDANACWSLEDAINVCRNFERFDIAWLEDPLQAPSDGFGRPLNAWRELRESTSVPLAFDQGSEDPRMREALVGADALDYVILKLARTGGPSAAMEIVRSLAGTGVKVGFTDSIETGIGQRAVLHTAAAACAQLETVPSVGLGGALTLVELDTEASAKNAPMANLRGPAPELTGLGLG